MLVRFLCFFLHFCSSHYLPCSDVVRCKSKRECGRYFHPECLQKLPGAADGVCPAHVCVNCGTHKAERKKKSTKSARKGPITRCLRCPLAYHKLVRCACSTCVRCAFVRSVCVCVCVVLSWRLGHSLPLCDGVSTLALFLPSFSLCVAPPYHGVRALCVLRS